MMQAHRTRFTAGGLAEQGALGDFHVASSAVPAGSESRGRKDHLRLGWFAAIAGVAAGYFLTGRFGLYLSARYLLASPIWPPTGLALAAMLVLGRRIWPAVLLGATLVNLSRLLGVHNALLPALTVALFIGAGNTLETIVGVWLVERFARGREAFQQPQSILQFALSVAVATAISASLGTLAVSFAGLEGRGHPTQYWFTWWLGDLVSALVLTPLVLVWNTLRKPAFTPRRFVEGAALIGLLSWACWLVFSGEVARLTGGANLTFLVIPPLLWAALRFGQRGTISLAFAIACVAVAGTFRGQGPFALADHLTSVVVLQSFIAVVTVMSLMLAADVVQRQNMDAGLRASEQRYRELFELNPQPMWVYDFETLRFLAVNDAAVRHYGYSLQEFLEMSIAEIGPPEMAPLLLEDVKRARAGVRESTQRRHRKKDGSLIDVELTRHTLTFDGRHAAMVLCRDITERKRAARRATAFSELGRRLSAATTPRAAAQIIADAADALFGWDMCVLDLCARRQDTMETVLCVDTVNGNRREFSPEESKPGSLAVEVLHGGPRLILRPDPPTFGSGSVPVGDTARPSASLMYVPLREEQEAIGIFSIQSYRPQAYTEEDLCTLQALAEHCSGALARIRAEEEIQRLNRELRRHLEELQTIFNVAPVGIAVSRDPECRTLTGNPACQALFGANGAIVLSEHGTDSRPLPFRLQRHGQEVALSELPMQRVARDGLAVRGEELDVLFPDGRIVNSLISASPLYDEAGRLRGSIAVMVDLTERKRAEQEILRLNSELELRVRQRTAQIESINKELEAFCYSVSHDLRAPLRSIRGFSEVLLERYAGKLDARGQEFLRRACQSSVQMDLLIEDLLKLSRVSRSELQRQTIDLSEMAAQVVEELRRTEPQRTIECVIAPKLQAIGDAGLVRVVLENLLRNAWKFTARQPQARIEFGFMPKPQPAFFVRDNGAGFDMAHADRLFGVFQRLHSASEFPGTGVGLATVQRIINRHGGRAWATGAPGQGATFYFTLAA